MARSLWSGAISFGLVTVPVKLVTATRDRDIRFHQIDRRSNSRVQYRMVSASTQEEVPRDEIVKGYEVSPEQYVLIDRQELDSLAPEKTRRIDISDFVDIKQIDPVYYERAYYLVPETQGAKAYVLLVKAMEEAGRVAIARIVMHNKEYLCALRPVSGVLCLETMKFADEVIKPEDLEDIPDMKVSDKELAMARQLIDTLAGEFDPEKYRDEYRQRIEELIQKKAEGVEVPIAEPERQPARVIDLMSALKASLEQAKKGKPPEAEHEHVAAGHGHRPHRRKSA